MTMAEENIKIVNAMSGATGWFTVSSKNTTTESVVSSTNTLATYDGNTLTLTSHATTGVVDSVGGWTINLGGKTPAASVVGGDTVNGTSGADSVSINGANVRLYLGSGADSVVSSTDEESVNAGALIDAGAGNDSISVKGSGVTVQAGTGDDFVSIVGDGAYIYGGAGADSIVAVGKNDYIEAGDGADSVLASITSGTLDLGAGNDFASVEGDSLTVYGQAGNDTVSVGGSQVTVYGGDGNDSLVAAGEQDVVSGDAGNDTISIGGASVTAYGGAGNDVISVQGNNAVVDAGAGADSVIVAADDAAITLGDGRDTVSIGKAAGVSLTDYTYGTDTLILGEGVGATTAGDGVAFDTTGLISTAAAQVQITSSDGYYKAALTKDASTSQRYAWVGSTGSTIDLSSESNNFYVVASLNDAEGDSILGGRGADSIIAGSNDTVNGGRGNDSISIATDATGVTVGLSANGGNDSVAGATVGFSADATTLYVDDASKLGFTLGDSSPLKASIKGASAEFTSVTGAVVDLKVNAAGTTTNYEIIASGKAAAIDEEASVLYGVGTNVSVSVGAGIGNSVIELSSKKQFGDTHTYTNINKIDATASDGEDILIGADTATTIAAGKGKTSLFGAGAAGDSLAGGDGDDTFFFGSGYGNDTIANYGKSGDDQIVFLSAQTGFTKDSSGLHMAIGTDSLTIQNVATTSSDANNMVYTLSVYGEDSFKAKIGMTSASSNFVYDSDVDMYLGGTKSDKLTFASGDNDSHQIWLGNTYNGTTYSSIEEVDASNASGDLLIWGATDESSTIKAGSGNSTIFGGFGSTGNDVLKGNSTSGSVTTYEFGLGCGNDTITGSKSADSILLWNVSSGDIDYTKTIAATTNSALNLVLTDGSTLTVQGITTGVKTVTLSDGSNWTYNTTSKVFEAAN